ncbi:MAG: hypothetical protein NVS3B10_22660 [Polyangiales bacterium]
MSDSDSDDDFDARSGSARKNAPTAFSSSDPPRNFTLSVNDRIRAMTIGAPAYAARKKTIEDREDRCVAVLVALHDTLVAKEKPHAHVTSAMLERAATFDLKRLNTLIASHNRYYPIEADLPIDPRTGGYLVYGRPWLPAESWTPERLVAQALAVIAARA